MPSRLACSSPFPPVAGYPTEPVLLIVLVPNVLLLPVVERSLAEPNWTGGDRPQQRAAVLPTMDREREG